MRTEIVVRSLTDFTGATYLGANLDIHAYGVRSTQWSDFTTPRTAEPARFFYHWESKVGVSHVGNVVAPWGRNTYRR